MLCLALLPALHGYGLALFIVRFIDKGHPALRISISRGIAHCCSARSTSASHFSCSAFIIILECFHYFSTWLNSLSVRMPSMDDDMFIMPVESPFPSAFSNQLADSMPACLPDWVGGCLACWVTGWLGGGVVGCSGGWACYALYFGWLLCSGFACGGCFFSTILI